MSGSADAELPATVVTAAALPAEPKFKPDPLPPDPDDVVLSIGGQRWQTWQAVRVTRGVERMPADFDLTVTENFPDPAQLGIRPAAPCKVQILGDLVLTGYVDRYAPAFDKSNHSVSFTGRSKCADLVDSAAIFEDANGQEIASQLQAVSALELARKIAGPFGISVTAPDGPGPVIPQHNALLTETGYEIIERVARFSQLLLYDDVDGNLVLAQAGKKRHASGIAEGVNAEAGRVIFAWDQRFTQYDVLLMQMNTLGDTTVTAEGNAGWNLRARLKDDTAASGRHDGKPRRRRRVIVVEQQWGGEDLALKRARWELARRFGRSQAVQVTTDSWRDSAGVLWEPNWLVPLNLPHLKIVGEDWLLMEVTYRRDNTGTHADLTLMPPEAVQPQPILLQPFNAQMYEALDK